MIDRSKIELGALIGLILIGLVAISRKGKSSAPVVAPYALTEQPNTDLYSIGASRDIALANDGTNRFLGFLSFQQGLKQLDVEQTLGLRQADVDIEQARIGGQVATRLGELEFQGVQVQAQSSLEAARAQAQATISAARSQRTSSIVGSIAGIATRVLSFF